RVRADLEALGVYLELRCLPVRGRAGRRAREPQDVVRNRDAELRGERVVVLEALDRELRSAHGLPGRVEHAVPASAAGAWPRREQTRVSGADQRTAELGGDRREARVRSAQREAREELRRRLVEPGARRVELGQARAHGMAARERSEEHTSELQSREKL